MNTRLLITLIFIGAIFTPILADEGKESAVTVFVSVLPQQYLAEKIGGAHVNVHVLVPPGQSPATFEPTQKQMAELNQAQLYLRIGVPFERTWMKRLASINPKMTVLDSRQGIELREMDSGHRHLHQQNNNRVTKKKDPHIWTSPLLLRVMAENLCDELIRLAPQHAGHYQKNFELFDHEMANLHAQIQDLLAPVQSRKMMVFHPSWGYFADAYQLQQIAIEMEGKSPGAKGLARLHQLAKQHGVRQIFIQPQMAKKDALVIAQAISAEVIEANPLAYDIPQSLIQLAKSIAKADL